MTPSAHPPYVLMRSSSASDLRVWELGRDREFWYRGMSAPGTKWISAKRL